MAPDLTILVCTYKRPALLAACMLALGRSAADPALAIRAELVVVDNSDDGSARSVVEAGIPAAPLLSVRYVQAHPANISVARNAGVAKARGTWIAFIDDDQQVAGDWLTIVMAATRDTDADILVGRVMGTYEDPDRAGPAARDLFDRPLDVPSGTQLYAYGPQKRANVTLATSNAIFRRATTLDEEAPFSLHFGDGGGEDYFLYCRLQTQRKIFRALPEAECDDAVPAARCTLDYLKPRAFAGGQAFVTAVVRSNPEPRQAEMAIIGRTLIQAALWPLKYALSRTIRRPHPERVAIQKSAIAGKLRWRRKILPIYRLEHQETTADSDHQG